MNKRCIVVIAFLVIGAVAVVAIIANQSSCNAQSCDWQAVAVAEGTEIEAINDDLDSGALLVDVRAAEEFAKSHASRAINLPYDQIISGKYPTQNKTTKIYLYCHSGKRAEAALNALKQAGYTDASSLISLDNWQKLGGEVVW
ncbi:MAG: rhodanese-like domain-containing protein [Candidatus Woesebacteria bacterium]|jgi:phage shock protein E